MNWAQIILFCIRISKTLVLLDKDLFNSVNGTTSSLGGPVFFHFFFLKLFSCKSVLPQVTTRHHA